MVSTEEVSKQLKRLHVNFQFWCHAEIKELPKVLFEGEQLHNVLVGRYEGGFALFCATDLRVLLIDKKPFYLTLEDIRYDMISDVQYNHRMIDATVRLGTLHKTIAFTGYNHNKLRDFTSYIQQQVMLYRQYQNNQQSTPEPTMAEALPVKPSMPVHPNPSLAVTAGIKEAVEPEPTLTTVSQQEQPTNTLPGVSTANAGGLTRPKRPNLNPYNMPVMIRRRVSRFY